MIPVIFHALNAPEELPADVTRGQRVVIVLVGPFMNGEVVVLGERPLAEATVEGLNGGPAFTTSIRASHALWG
jgi:hypothetical protein